MMTVIIGAGAAGLTAAAFIKGDVVVLERNEKAGKKLYITGKGRCNFTNACSAEECLRAVITNPKFLIGAMHKFSPSDTIDFFERAGVPTKVERGRRAFPESDKSSDIIKALVSRAQGNGAKIVYNQRVVDVGIDGGRFLVRTQDANYNCDNLIIACGGKSYPSTGSDGSGYELAKKFGHTVNNPRPVLVGLKVKESVRELEGLSLENVRVSVKTNDKSVDKNIAHYCSDVGDMIFTRDGVSGPLILTLSSLLPQTALPTTLSIDLKPALDEKTLDKRVIRDFESNYMKQFKNSLDKLLPKSIIPYIIRNSGIDENKPVKFITAAERARLVSLMKSLDFTVTDFGGFNEAVITRGGIEVKEINPTTMESKLVPNLYFAGEIIDVDALTGGYNLQIAFATAVAAGRSCGEKC